MKKTAILLALVLALGLVQSALAASGDVVLYHDEEIGTYFTGSFALGDAYYMYNYNGLYRYRVGEAEATLLTVNLPDEEDGDISVCCFAWGEEPGVVLLRARYNEEDYSEFVGAEAGVLVSGEDGELDYEKRLDIDWSELVEEYDDGSYASEPYGMIAVGDTLYVRYMDFEGDIAVGAIDLESGRFKRVEDADGAVEMTLWRDDNILLEQFDFTHYDEVGLMCLDTATGEVEELGRMKVAPYTWPTAPAYDAETDTVYCFKGGEICPLDVEGAQVLEGVTNMPLEVFAYSNTQAAVLPGGYYAYCSEGLAVRNLDPAQQASTRLRVLDSSMNLSVPMANDRFSNTHGDVSVVLDRASLDPTQLVERMLNRDDSVDVYILSTELTAYQALFERGYLLELDGSEGVMALAERMYPGLREAFSNDGHMVALPVSVYGSTLAVNEEALGALGLTLEDVPDNWSDMLDFLIELPERLGEDSKVLVFYPGYTVEDARMEVFGSLFHDYQRYVNATDPAMGYNTPMLRGLLEKLERVDFQALGCIEEEELEEDDSFFYEVSDSGGLEPLFSWDYGCVFGYFYGDYTPVLMSLEPGGQRLLGLTCDVAVVNPFTQNPEVALEYMGTLAECLSQSVLYCLDPSLNEPVRGTWNEENLAQTQTILDTLYASLDGAEPADRQMIEEAIESYQESYAYYETYGWEVSEASLEWYRGHDDNLVLEAPNWIYNDLSGEGNELIYQYTSGKISMDEMLEGLDHKVQMMLMEGN